MLVVLFSEFVLFLTSMGSLAGIVIARGKGRNTIGDKGKVRGERRPKD